MPWYWEIWQNLPDRIDPVIFRIGWFKIQYYGLMYIVAFATVYYMVKYRVKNEERFGLSVEQIQDLTTVAILGLILGARLGYVLFYNLSYYLSHPLEIFLPLSFSDGMTFTGISGMSYHGGIIGVLVSCGFYIRKKGMVFLDILDLYVPVVPLGYTFGRIGNFINGELYGRITDLPFGMHFPLAPGPELRHPSQLYEAFFEGVFLFVVLTYLRKVRGPRGAMLAFYLMGYGIVRFFIEFVREPDDHIGFVFFSITMGQILCSAMILCGIVLLVYLWRSQRQAT